MECFHYEADNKIVYSCKKCNYDLCQTCHNHRKVTIELLIYFERGAFQNLKTFSCSVLIQSHRKVTFEFFCFE